MRRLLLAAGACWRGVQLLCGQHSGRALGVLVLELRVDLLGEVGFALRLVELCELQLRETGRHSGGRLGGEFIVEIDGLLIAAGLAIELRKRELGEGGEGAVPAGGDLLWR